MYRPIPEEKYMEYARKILQVKQDWEKELKDLTENNEGN